MLLLALRLLATQYILCGGVLYGRSYEGVHLRCVDKEEAEKLIKEVHQGVCGLHMNGRMLAKKIVRLGLYWVTMEADCWVWWGILKSMNQKFHMWFNENESMS